MINEETRAEIETAFRGDHTARITLGSLTESELRQLRSEIDAMLPKVGLSELNLEQELVDQYYKTKDLMDEVSTDADTPANQRAQVCNAVTSSLAQLVKLQEDLRREETLKLMESCLVEAIKFLPDESKENFYEDYERLAKKAGLM